MTTARCARTTPHPHEPVERGVDDFVPEDEQMVGDAEAQVEPRHECGLRQGGDDDEQLAGDEDAPEGRGLHAACVQDGAHEEAGEGQQLAFLVKGALGDACACEHAPLKRPPRRVHVGRQRVAKPEEEEGCVLLRRPQLAAQLLQVSARRHRGSSGVSG